MHTVLPGNKSQLPPFGRNVDRLYAFSSTVDANSPGLDPWYSQYLMALIHLSRAQPTFTSTNGSYLFRLVPLPFENTVIEITINAIVNMGLLLLPTD
ncbi:uncharacterized protein BO88DRAFT_173002 [Aspergillus vadensis CBS 113365]|uniref:Uncharacterized protein n=1 Tax=Aspergillus vadensis (strain CBS 113365 / IMI 142717 / IBT 24658) TaxID=1448311 RepID=A0A319BKQ6_ASPVC|nr:hypothetical protein BO88DRAFT_173002 [Aspergillus vadensis CBS 113365]PYH72921.1 hypothetical protein BO88DRAFT_173002 [Aspergillus vadensis CBS 113365]